MRAIVFAGLMLASGMTALAAAPFDYKHCGEEISAASVIETCAQKQYFGGYQRYDFAQSEKSILVIIGMPTSGVVTSMISVYERLPNGKYRRLLSRDLRNDMVKVRETPVGIEFYAEAPVLILPWSGIATDKR